MKTEDTQETRLARWKPLDEALGQEVKEHGRLLQLLEIQEKVILQDNPDSLREITRAIDYQVEVISMMREEREQTVRVLARHCGIREGNELTDLLLFAPESLKAALTASLEESLSILTAIKDKTRENKELLSGGKKYSRAALRPKTPQSPPVESLEPAVEEAAAV